MKNLTKIFMAVVAGMFAFSCVTDTTEDLGIKVEGQGVTELTLSLEESRTHLGEKVTDENGVSRYPLYWSEGDAIAVNGVVSAPLTAGGEATAVFKFNEEVTAPLCVVYPASAAATVEEGEGEGEATEPAPVTAYPVTFANVQPYTVGTFAPQAAPMYGYATTADNAIELNHLTGVLRLAIAGNGEKVTSIKVTAQKGKIAGAYTVDCTTGVVTPNAEAVSSLTVTFAEPLVLGAEATPVYLTVPAGNYGTFMITVYTEADKMTVKFNSDIKPINAGAVREFKEFTYEANANDSEDVFEIDSKEALIEFARIAGTFYPRTKAVVTAEIDMTGYDWTPIANFGEFEFDGGKDEGHSIKGLNAPLFGSTAATIKNLELTGVDITITDLAKSGAIACELHNGSLENCKATGKININNTTLTIEKPLNQYGDIVHGGLVGHVFGATVKDCVNDVDITVTSFCAETQSIKSAVGGVVGGATSAGVGCTFNNLTNDGNIDYVCTTQKENVYLSGVVGKESDGTSDVDIAKIDNCTNNGYISTSKTSQSGTMLLAGITGVLDSDVATLCENLTNNGALTHSGTCGGFRAAGIASYWAHATAKNWHNTANGDITVADDATISTTCYLSGLVSGTFTTNGISLCDNEGALTIGDNITFNGYVRLSGIADAVGSTETPEISCWNNGPLSIGYCSNTKTDTNSGRLYMAGLINTLNSGALNECDNKVGGTITANLNSWASQLMIGGIVGYQGGTISIKDQVLSLTDCENFAAIDIKAVSANAAYVGGISGQSYVDPGDKLDFTAKLTRCHNHAPITVGGEAPGATRLGGVMGHINTIHTLMEDCENKNTATLTLNSEGSTGLTMGGVLGYSTPKRSATITDCTNAATLYNNCVANNFQIGGIVGYHKAAGSGYPLTITGTVGVDTNSGDILCKKGLTGTGGTSRNCVAGILGSVGGGDKNTTYDAQVSVLNCTNSGTVEYGTVAFAGRVDLAGIWALTNTYTTGLLCDGCTNKGDVIFNANCPTVSYEQSIGGIFGTAQSQLTISNCVNTKDAEILSNGAAKSNYELGGIAGSTSGTGVQVINCINYAPVTMTKASGGTTQIGGVIGYAYTYGRISGCANYGTVTGYAKAQTGIAGVVGYARQRAGTDNTVYLTDCYNAGEVIAKGTGTTTGVGGIIGITYGNESGAHVFNNLVNVGKITYTATASAPGIGGILGHDRSKGNHTITNSSQYGEIKAIGLEGKVGLIFGIARTDNIVATNCKVGGNMVFAVKKDYEYDMSIDEEVEIITNILTPITADNYFKYIYNTPITADQATEDGCGWLSESEKPAVPVYTPAN